MTRLERLRRALEVVTERPCVAMASTSLKLRNPLNGSGGTTKGARYAANARRRVERVKGNVLGLRLGGALSFAEVAVVLTRVSPRPFDDDNLAAAFKSVRDGMADRWGLDDADPRVTWLYDWRKGPRAVELVEAALWVLPDVPPGLLVVEERERLNAVIKETLRKLAAQPTTTLVGPPMPPPGRVIQDFDADDYNGRPHRVVSGSSRTWEPRVVHGGLSVGRRA